MRKLAFLALVFAFPLLTGALPFKRNKRAVYASAATPAAVFDLVAALDAGPDTSQCPAPTDTVSPPSGTLFFCDCGTGSDPACVAGNDANPGTAASPKQTYSAARVYFDTFGTTQHVALCRGGVWDITAGQRFRGNNACSAITPCVWKDYIPSWGSALSAAPRLNRTDSTAAYTIEGDPGANPLDNMVFANFAISASNATPPSLAAVFLYANVQNVQFRCVDIADHGQGFSLAGNTSSDGLVIADSVIHDNTIGNGITGRIHANMTVERNYFHDNGDGNTEHNVYFNQGPFAGTGTGLYFGHNISYRSSLVSGGCSGVSVTAHNTIFDGAVYEYNLIYEPPGTATANCWGLSIDAAGGNTEAHYNTVIRGNVIMNVGNVAIGVASSDGTIIENNVVIHENTGYSATAIAVPDRVTSAPDIDNTATTVRNNTAYVGPSASLVGVSIGTIGTGYVSTNNVVYADATAGTVTCYTYGLAAGAYTLVDSNTGFNCDTLESGTTGMDASLLSSDPLLINPPTNPQHTSASPSKDSGTLVSAPTLDLLGVARGSHPDRGAFEVFVPWSDEVSLDLDGSNDYVTIADSADFQSLAEMTIVLWFKQDGLAVNETLISKWQNAPANNTYTIQTDSTSSDEIRAFIAATTADAGSNYGVTTNANVAAGRWTFLAVRFYGAGAANADRLRIWRGDTVQGLAETTMSYVGTIPATLTAGTYAVEMGRAGALGRYFGPGNLDNVMIYNVALSPTAITTLYNAGVPAEPDATGLVSSYLFDNDIYPTIFDLVSAHDGTMTNMAADDLVFDSP